MIRGYITDKVKKTTFEWGTWGQSIVFHIQPVGSFNEVVFEMTCHYNNFSIGDFVYIGPREDRMFKVEY